MYTITSQGSFVSDGLSRVIQAPQGIDWFTAFNYTRSAAYTADTAFRWTWYRGMPINDALVETNIAAHFFATEVAIRAIGGYAGAKGFTLIDSTVQLPVLQGTLATNTNAVNPVITTTAVALPLEQGTLNMNTDRTVIRMNYTAVGGGLAPQIMGIDYTVTVLSPTTFQLPAHATAIPLNVVAGATFTVVSYDTNPLFYPVNRTVINITQDNPAVVTTSVIHGYTVGQKIRLKVPLTCGMTEMNDRLATVTVVPTAYTFTTDIDSTGFTAFRWPLAADYPFQIAEAIPVGEAASYAIPPLPFVNYAASFLDATENRGYTGMILGAGIPADAPSLRTSPAGTANDLIYWQAGKVVNL